MPKSGAGQAEGRGAGGRIPCLSVFIVHRDASLNIYSISTPRDDEVASRSKQSYEQVSAESRKGLRDRVF